MSTYEMQKEMRDAVEKNIPAAIGDALRKRLDMAEQDANKARNLEAALEKANARIVELDNQVKAAGNLAARETHLDSRERALEKTELELLRKDAQCDAAVHKARADTAVELVKLLVRNTEFRESISRNGSVPVSQGTNYPVTMPHNEVVTTTRSAD